MTTASYVNHHAQLPAHTLLAGPRRPKGCCDSKYIPLYKVVDDICATVPLFLGSQVESMRMRSGLVEYPHAETTPVTLTHRHSAPLMGVWHMFTYLRNLQNADLGLPFDQQVWIQEQTERVLVVYFQR